MAKEDDGARVIVLPPREPGPDEETERPPAVVIEFPSAEVHEQPLGRPPRLAI